MLWKLFFYLKMNSILLKVVTFVKQQLKYDPYQDFFSSCRRLVCIKGQQFLTTSRPRRVHHISMCIHSCLRLLSSLQTQPMLIFCCEISQPQKWKLHCDIILACVGIKSFSAANCSKGKSPCNHGATGGPLRPAISHHRISHNDQTGAKTNISFA